MSSRALFLDRAPGETRGVVTLNGRPERLLIERGGEDQSTRLGARLVARVRKVEPAFASAFLDLGGVEAMMAFKPDGRPVQGQSLEVEIRSEPLPDCLEVTAWTDPGGEMSEIMGVRHKTLAVEGVQFHPESILTEHGHDVLRNFLQG